MMENKTNEKSKLIKNNEIELLNKYRVPLMGFSALWILFFHLWRPVLFNIKYISTIEKLLKIIGYYGVDIFFFLSGIGLTYSIAKTNVWGFYYKRIKRIILPFIIMSLILKIYNNWSFIEFLKRVSFYSFYTRSIYSLIWFVPAIVTLYLVFPLYYKIFEKISCKTLFTIAIVLIICSILILFRNFIRLDLYGFFNRIPIFVIGILYGWKEQNQKVNYNKNKYLIYILMLIIGIVISYLINIEKWHFVNPKFDLFIHNTLVAISISFLLPKIFEIFNNSKIKPIFDCNKLNLYFLSFIGTMSFEIYCVQEWLVKLAAKYIIKDPVITNLITFIVTLILGIILYIVNKYFWILIEKIFNKNRGDVYKMKKIVLATNNNHKLREFKEMINDYDILALKDIGYLEDIEETGETFEENALIKAETIHKYLKDKDLDYIVISDDSGLCVESLNGAPGVYSARYAGEHGDNEANRNKLRKELIGKERKAYFICTIALYYPNGEFKTFEGKTYGKIIDEELGTKDFAYDCIFLSDELNKTFGQASEEEKNSVSHRSRAIQKLLEVL